MCDHFLAKIASKLVRGWDTRWLRYDHFEKWPAWPPKLWVLIISRIYFHKHLGAYFLCYNGTNTRVWHTSKTLKEDKACLKGLVKN